MKIKLESIENEFCTGEISFDAKNIEKVGDSFKVSFFDEKTAGKAQDEINGYGDFVPVTCVGKSELFYRHIKVKPYSNCKLKATCKDINFCETI